MKNRNNIILATIVLVLGFAALSSISHAVVPPPDGGYPGGNTAEGQAALFSLTTGGFNTAVGFLSLRSDVTASFNTSVGAGTLALTTGGQNTAVGAAALLLNTAGESNTAVGVTALLNNTDGSGNSAFGWGALAANTADANTAVGLNALLNNTTGGTVGNIQGFDLGPNVAVGAGALRDNTVASANTAVGFQALRNFTTGPMGLEQVGLCTAVGFQALANDTTAGNSAFGYQALFNNGHGTENVAIGMRALFSNTTANNNIAVGNSALRDNTEGHSNTAIGSSALESNVDGEGNTAVGLFALDANQGGDSNTAIGTVALSGNTTGLYNTAIGFAAGGAIVGAFNVICIGANVTGEDVSNSCYIGNIFGQPGGSQAVYVNSDGKLGAQVSSRRFKEEIKPMDNVSEALFSLKPVTFHYKKEIDPASKSQFGLVAEEVENVNPDLVVCDKDGKPYTVRYDQVNAMLLNEFLKEHKEVEEQQATIGRLTSSAAQQQATITELKKEMGALVTELKEQAAQIQKVSAQIQASRSAPEVVLNNP
jgi:hypothetical protein